MPALKRRAKLGQLPKECVKLLSEKGWTVGNIDAMICLEAPKINPHAPTMKGNIANAMGISDEDISIKATTNETMGFVGRQEGIVAYAVYLIKKGASPRPSPKEREM